MEKIKFKTIWEKSKVDFKENFLLLIKIALVLSALTIILSIISINKLEDKTFDFAKQTIITNSNYPESLKVINLIFNFCKYLTATLILIYLFDFRTHKKTNLNRDFKLLKHGILPLILMTIIFIMPMYFLLFSILVLFYLGYYLLTVVSFILLIIYILLSEYIYFFSYAILFRNKLFLDSYAYSYNLIKGNFGRTLLLGLYFVFKTLLVILGIILISAILIGINTTLKSEQIYFLNQFVLDLLLLIYTYFFTIFAINYFLALEKEKGLSNEFYIKR